eukprot:6756331-Alexandrium_andersonii.AAC.1
MLCGCVSGEHAGRGRLRMPLDMVSLLGGCRRLSAQDQLSCNRRDRLWPLRAGCSLWRTENQGCERVPS